MKSALKIRLLFVLFVVICSVNAQVYRLEVGYNNPVRTGTGASANLSNINPLPIDVLNTQVGSLSSTYFNGIHLGATVEYDLKNQFSLLTGALYNLVYSDKIQIYPKSTSITYVTWGHSLDIPIRLTYTQPLSRTLKVFGFAGPNINIGLYQSTKTTSDVSYIPSKFSDLYKDAVLNRLNFQLGAGGGVQWKKYQLKAGYDFGINNLNRLGTGNMYQKGWYVTFGYSF
ncbi:MAG: outer membrane beta-barrel protein [Bacteroidota bacterium]|nr:outer membrane beta-barrel protein [Bacteroidota bacterium]